MSLMDYLDDYSQSEEFKALPPEARRKRLEELYNQAYPPAYVQKNNIDAANEKLILKDTYAPITEKGKIEEIVKKLGVGVVGATEAPGQLIDLPYNTIGRIVGGKDFKPSRVQELTGRLGRELTGLSEEEINARPWARMAGNVVGSLPIGGAVGALAKTGTAIKLGQAIDKGGKAARAAKLAAQLAIPAAPVGGAVKNIAQGVIGGAEGALDVSARSGKDATPEEILRGAATGAILPTVYAGGRAIFKGSSSKSSGNPSKKTGPTGSPPGSPIAAKSSQPLDAPEIPSPKPQVEANPYADILSEAGAGTPKLYKDEIPVEAPKVETEVSGRVIGEGGLPSNLAKSRPRYNYGKKQFEPQFEDDVDKALFIVAQEKGSAKNSEFLTYLKSKFPNKTDADLRQMGKDLKANVIKPLAAQAPEGSELIVPKQMKEFNSSPEAKIETREAFKKRFTSTINDLDKAIAEDPKNVNLLKVKDAVLKHINQADDLDGGTLDGVSSRRLNRLKKNIENKFAGEIVEYGGQSAEIINARAVSKSPKAGMSYVQLKLQDGTTTVVPEKDIKRFLSPQEKLLAKIEAYVKSESSKALLRHYAKTNPEIQQAKEPIVQSKPNIETGDRQLKAFDSEDSKVYSKAKAKKIKDLNKQKAKEKNAVAKFLTEEKGSVEAEDALFLGYPREKVKKLAGKVDEVVSRIVDRPYTILRKTNKPVYDYLLKNATKAEIIEGNIIREHRGRLAQIEKMDPAVVKRSLFKKDFISEDSPGIVKRSNPKVAKLMDSGLTIDELADHGVLKGISGYSKIEKAIAYNNARAIKKTMEALGMPTKDVLPADILQKNEVVEAVLGDAPNRYLFQNFTDASILTDYAIRGLKSKVLLDPFKKGGALSNIIKKAQELGDTKTANALKDIKRHIKARAPKQDQIGYWTNLVKSNIAQMTLLNSGSTGLKNVTQNFQYGSKLLGLKNIVAAMSRLPRIWFSKTQQDRGVREFLKNFNLDASKFAKVGIDVDLTDMRMRQMEAQGYSAGEMYQVFEKESTQKLWDMFGGSEKHFNQTAAITASIIKQFKALGKTVDDAYEWMAAVGNGTIPRDTFAESVIGKAMQDNSDINFSILPGDRSLIESQGNNPLSPLFALMTHSIRDVVFVNDKVNTILKGINGKNLDQTQAAFGELFAYLAAKSFIAGSDVAIPSLKATVPGFALYQIIDKFPELKAELSEGIDKLDENSVVPTNVWEKAGLGDSESAFSTIKPWEFADKNFFPALNFISRLANKTGEALDDENSPKDKLMAAEEAVALATGLTLGSFSIPVPGGKIPIGYQVLNRALKLGKAYLFDKTEEGEPIAKVNKRETPTDLVTQVKRWFMVRPEDAAVYNDPIVRKALVDKITKGYIQEYYQSSDAFQSQTNREIDELVRAKYGDRPFAEGEGNLQDLRDETVANLIKSVIKTEIDKALEDSLRGNEEAVTVRLERLRRSTSLPIEDLKERLSERQGNRNLKRLKSGFTVGGKSLEDATIPGEEAKANRLKLLQGAGFR